MEDLNEAGGVYAVLKELTKLELLDTTVMTCTGKTLGENIADAVNLDTEVIRTVENPYSKTGGIAVLRGNLAPDGCVVKRSAVAPEMLWPPPLHPSLEPRLSPADRPFPSPCPWSGGKYLTMKTICEMTPRGGFCLSVSD